MKFQQISEGLGQEADVMEQDHEVQMARADCFHAAKHAIELHKILRNISERQGLEGWVSEKITLAADYLRTVKEYLEYETQDRSGITDDVIRVKSPDEYNEIFSQYMNESKKPRIAENQNDLENIKNIEKRIKTTNLSARGRELLIKAFARFPQSASEVDAIINYLEYIKSAGETDVNRLDRENRDQDQDIASLEAENNAEQREIQVLKAKINNMNPVPQMAAPTTQTTVPDAVKESKRLKKKSVKEMGSVGSVGSGSIGAAISAPRSIKPQKAM